MTSHDQGQISGYFLSFEGGDSAGKSTHIRLLAQWLTQHTSRDVVVTREPGGTTLGTQIRELLLHGVDMDAKTEALLYAADRAQHVAEVIRPALARGAVVLSDRYLDSTVAYQGAGRALNVEDVERLSLWAANDLMPDRTYLLDLDPKVAASRRHGKHDRIESAGDEFHQRIREQFRNRAAADESRWLIIDAANPIDVIQTRIRSDVAELLSIAVEGD